MPQRYNLAPSRHDQRMNDSNRLGAVGGGRRVLLIAAATVTLIGCAPAPRPGSFADDQARGTRTERPFTHPTRDASTSAPRMTDVFDADCPDLVTAEDVNRATGLSLTTIADVADQIAAPDVPDSVSLPFGSSSVCAFVGEAGDTVVVLTIPLPSEDAAEQVMDAMAESGEFEPVRGVGSAATSGSAGLFAREGSLILSVQVITEALSDADRRAAAIELANLVFSRL